MLLLGVCAGHITEDAQVRNVVYRRCRNALCMQHVGGYVHVPPLRQLRARVMQMFVR